MASIELFTNTKLFLLKHWLLLLTSNAATGFGSKLTEWLDVSLQPLLPLAINDIV